MPLSSEPDKHTAYTISLTSEPGYWAADMAGGEVGSKIPEMSVSSGSQDMREVLAGEVARHLEARFGVLPKVEVAPSGKVQVEMER